MSSEHFMNESRHTAAGHTFRYQNVFELLADRCRETPDRPFVISLFQDAEEQYTYREFMSALLRVRRYLATKNLQKGDAINLLVQNSADFLGIYFAGLSLGLVISPINYNLTPREVGYIIKSSRGKLMFAEDTHLDVAEDAIREVPDPPEIVVLSRKTGSATRPRLCDLVGETDTDATTAHANDTPEVRVGLEDEAVIIYTSGTSGDPKGAVLTHSNLLADAQAIAEWFRFDRGTRALCILPLFHNNGQVVTLLAPLWAGGSTVMIKGNTNLRVFWDLVTRYQANWSSVIPTILSVLLNFKIRRTDHAMKGIICGGALLPRRVQLDFEETFSVPVFEGYGLTETTSFSCFNPVTPDDRIIGSIGIPMPVNEMAILDEEGHELRSNAVGEICIRGYNVFSRYCNFPELSTSVFRGGWFHSGDFGFKDERDFYYIQGRKDDLIIKGGENIYPREIENVLYGHPRIKNCAVIGIDHKLWGETLAVFVETVEGQRMTAEEVVGFLKGRIADYKIPSECYFLDELPDLKEMPKGPTNKILRKDLKKYWAARIDGGAQSPGVR
jgi:acyl-CoA synthetase (AMP-forming)/AMP-acid ligase II